MRELLRALLGLNIKALFGDKTTNPYIQFFRYIFVGGIAFAVDALVLWLSEKFMSYMLAAAIAFVAGLAVNYLLSVFFVFSESENVKNRPLEFTAYAVIGVIGLGLTEAIMYFLTDICHIYFMISKIFAAAAVLVWNFAARRKFIYTSREDKE